MDISLFDDITLDSLLESESLSKTRVEEEWITKLNSVKHEKNEAARNKRYEECASLRDWELALFAKMMKHYIPEDFETVRLLQLGDTEVHLAASKEVLWRLGYDKRGENINKLKDWNRNNNTSK